MRWRSRLKNRQMMKQRCQEALEDFMPCAFDHEVNIHHNFAAAETHFGQEVIVHRKGATQAGKGQLGIIPGSMGTAFVLRSRGLATRKVLNRARTARACHGRNEANRRLNAEDVRRP